MSGLGKQDLNPYLNCQLGFGLEKKHQKEYLCSIFKFEVFPKVIIYKG